MTEKPLPQTAIDRINKARPLYGRGIFKPPQYAQMLDNVLGRNGNVYRLDLGSTGIFYILPPGFANSLRLFTFHSQEVHYTHLTTALESVLANVTEKKKIIEITRPKHDRSPVLVSEEQMQQALGEHYAPRISAIRADWKNFEPAQKKALLNNFNNLVLSGKKLPAAHPRAAIDPEPS